MLAVLQHAVILLMPCVSTLITPLGLAQMQMRACVCLCVHGSVRIKSAIEEWVKEHSPTKPYPHVIVFKTCN